MREILAALLLLLASSASAQKLDDVELMNNFEKAISALDDLQALTKIL